VYRVTLDRLKVGNPAIAVCVSELKLSINAEVIA
jgi:hypothetical protein